MANPSGGVVDDLFNGFKKVSASLLSNTDAVKRNLSNPRSGTRKGLKLLGIGDKSVGLGRYASADSAFGLNSAINAIRNADDSMFTKATKTGTLDAIKSALGVTVDDHISDVIGKMTSEQRLGARASVERMYSQATGGTSTVNKLLRSQGAQNVQAAIGPGFRGTAINWGKDIGTDYIRDIYVPGAHNTIFGAIGSYYTPRLSNGRIDTLAAGTRIGATAFAVNRMTDDDRR